MCHSCGSKGHFSKVCKSGRRPQRNNRSGYNSNSDYRQYSSNSVYNNPEQSTLASVLPNALSDAVINVKVNGVTTRALIDSGSSDSFINYCTVRKLGIKITQHDKQSICMAAKTCVSETVGSVYVDLEVVGHKHNGIRLQVLDNLCCDIIVGHDILNKHDKLVINFGGQNSSFVVDNISHSGFACALTPVIFNPPPLFEHLARDIYKREPGPRST